MVSDPSPSRVARCSRAGHLRAFGTSGAFAQGVPLPQLGRQGHAHPPGRRRLQATLRVTRGAPPMAHRGCGAEVTCCSCGAQLLHPLPAKAGVAQIRAGTFVRREQQLRASGNGVFFCFSDWGYGATAARLTPDQKVGSSNLSGLNFHWQLLGRVLSAAARPARPAALAPAEVRVPQLLLALQLCGSSPCIAA